MWWRQELTKDISSLRTGAQQTNATEGVMRTVTGVLSSRLTSRDIKIDGFSMYVRRAFSLPRISTRLGSPPRMHIMGEEGWAAC